MTRLTIASVVVFFGFGSAAARAAGERVALMPVTGVNVHEGYLQAAQDLARGHLEEAGYQVVPIGGPNNNVEVDPGSAAQAGQSVQAHYTVVVHVTRLGASAKVKMTAYHAGSGQLFWRGQLSASSPDDIDTVMARLAKGMATGQAPADTAEIDTVTEKEADPYVKMAATSVFGVRISAVSPLARPDSGDEAALPGIGVFWLYDVRTFLADITLDYHTSDGEGDFSVALGAYYPFSRSNTTPYLGGGLRYGYADYGYDGGWGVSAVGSVGVLFGRLSTVQLRGEASIFFNMFEEENFEGERARSAGLLVSAGIGF